MALSERLAHFLDRKGVHYQQIDIEPVANLDAAVIASGKPQRDFVRATLLIDISGVVMVVHRFDTTLDMDAIGHFTDRRLQPLTARQAARLFSDCGAGFVPPVGAPWGVPVLLDEDLAEAGQVVFSGGTDNSLVEMDGRGFRLMLADARRGHLVIRGQGTGSRDALTLEDVADRLQRLYRLPPMPALALRILRLTANNDSSARELAELIEFDPSLTAQIMRYARSALFNYAGQINSVQEAVTRVLGFDRVAHIALGIASIRAFDVPREGMLGMDAFWRHSLYCAFLSQSLAELSGRDKGLAYLCGLLHNFGLLLIGHLFPSEYEELNALREINPEVSMHSLEQEVFGHGQGQEILAVGHGAIGGILHRLWQLPEPVIKAAAMHQNPGYQGEHADYVHLVQLANALLKDKGIGDEFNPDDVPALAKELGLDMPAVERAEREMEQVAPNLDVLASSLAS